PSGQFIQIIRSAIEQASRLGDKNPLTLVTDSSNSVVDAKILLHAHGINEERIATATVFHQSSPPGTILIGDCAAESTNHATSPLSASQQAGFQTAVIVMGNHPLDDMTPTVDLTQRILTAVEY